VGHRAFNSPSAHYAWLKCQRLCKDEYSFITPLPGFYQPGKEGFISPLMPALLSMEVAIQRGQEGNWLHGEAQRKNV